MRMNRRRDIILTSLKFHKSAGDVSEVFLELWDFFSCIRCSHLTVCIREANADESHWLECRENRLKVFKLINSLSYCSGPSCSKSD